MLNHQNKHEPKKPQSKHGERKHPEIFRKLKDVLKNGFVIERQEPSDKEPQKITNPELLDLSEQLAKALYNRTKFRQRSDTMNQFRKFFNEVSRLKNLLHNPSKLSVELRKLRARMSYAAGRETITRDFSTLINTCIDRAIELSDFQYQIPGFCDFFESLYAYYYYYNRAR
jgi:CRISPR type III-A-associated protein Csm2